MVKGRICFWLARWIFHLVSLRLHLFVSFQLVRCHLNLALVSDEVGCLKNNLIDTSPHVHLFVRCHEIQRISSSRHFASQKEIRLKKITTKKVVGLQHGKQIFFAYQFFWHRDITVEKKSHKSNQTNEQISDQNRMFWILRFVISFKNVEMP